jgi:hypothetical protein
MPRRRILHLGWRSWMSFRMVRMPVVGADHDDGDLGGEALELAVAEAPDHVFGPVAADAEVGGLEGREVLVPHGLSAASPAVGDGVAREEEVDAAGPGDLEELVMAVAVFLRGDGGAGPLALRDGGDNQDEGEAQADHGVLPADLFYDVYRKG